LNSDRVHSKIAKLSSKNIYSYWNKYLDYVKEHPIKCDENQILNSETLKCIKRGSATYSKSLIDMPVKSCPTGKVYDIFTNKCTESKKLKSIDIVMDEILKLNIGSRHKFTHLGTSNGIIASSLFVLSKHTNGHLIFPSDDTKQNSKRTFMIMWTYDKAEKRHILKMPDGFWNSFDEGMHNNKARFIIGLISLTSSVSGGHANVLIYDKSTHELERFDSLGGLAHGSFQVEDLDTQIKALFEEQKNIHLPNFKYFTPVDYCPREIYQIRDIDEIGYLDVAGNCAVWRLWYIDLRLSNPDLKRKEVVSLSMKKIEHYGSFQKFIKSYQVYVTNNMGAITESPKK
jgi:hypothetical protein